MPQRIPRRGSVYYIRRVIPLDLQAVLGCRERWISLRTKDYPEAQRRYRAEDVKFDQLFARLRRELSERQPLDPSLKTASATEADEMRLRDFEADEFLREIYADEDFNEEETGLPYAVWLKQREEKERIEAAAYFAEERRTAQVSLLDLFDKYAVQRGVRQETARQWRGHLKHIVDFLGHDNALSIKAPDIRRWRDRLEEEAGPRGKPRSAKTINGSYLAALQTTLAWAVDRDLIPDNAAASVKRLTAKRTPVLRERTLTADEQRKILSATLAPHPAKLGRFKAASRRWVPWLCAYTGARVSEITQARAQDVCKIDGVWALKITPEAGSVKTSRARTVPLHPHLIEQGFLDFVESAEGPLFYQSRPNPKPNARPPYKIVANRLGDWVREIGVTEVPQPNHSWRHTFKTLAREVGMPEAAADYIQGHAPASDSRAYGTHSIATLAAEIRKLPRFSTS